MKKNTPLDYITQESETLVPVQVRLPSSLVKQVKAKLTRSGLTMTNLIKGTLLWYVNHATDAVDDQIKKRLSGKVRG